MRGSQIFAALVIIALLVMGAIYLEDHGYFRDQRLAAMGALKPDANAPQPGPPEADQAGTQSTAVVYPPAQINPAAVDTAATANTARPAAGAGNPATTPGTANTVIPASTAASVDNTKVVYKIVYVDAQGRACRPRRVAVRDNTAAHFTTTHFTTARTTARAPRYPRRLVDNTSWIYGTAPQPSQQPRRTAVAGNACSLFQQTATGQRVVNLPAGMAFNVALDSQLSTMDSFAGEGFNGSLIGPITYCGEVIVPAGAAVQGTVVRARRRAGLQETDAVLQLRLSTVQANGANMPLEGFSTNRYVPGEVPYRTVDYINDPNFENTGRQSTHDVLLPAKSVVTFTLHSSAQVNF